jgi:hypothetical protein
MPPTGTEAGVDVLHARNFAGPARAVFDVASDAMVAVTTLPLPSA